MRGSADGQRNLVDPAHDVFVGLVDRREHLGLGRQLTLDVWRAEDALQVQPVALARQPLVLPRQPRRQRQSLNGHLPRQVTGTLDTAPLSSESSPQKRPGMARVLKGSHSFTCTATRSSAIRMSHTCLCLPSGSWYSFTDPGGMEG